MTKYIAARPATATYWQAVGGAAQSVNGSQALFPELHRLYSSASGLSRVGRTETTTKTAWPQTVRVVGPVAACYWLYIGLFLKHNGGVEDSAASSLDSTYPYRGALTTPGIHRGMACDSGSSTRRGTVPSGCQAAPQDDISVARYASFDASTAQRYNFPSKVPFRQVQGTPHADLYV